MKQQAQGELYEMENLSDRPKAFYDQYQEPSVGWLNKKLVGVKLGWLKASEMEIYLAYMQMYSNGHLHCDAYDIADLYGYTESKVAKLQVEFARRFKNNTEDDKQFLTRILESMRPAKDKEDALIKVSNDNGKLCFSVKNASEVRRIRRIAAKNGLVVGSVINNTEFSLQPDVFASLFMVCDSDFKKQMKKYAEKTGKTLAEAFPTTGQLITRVGVDIVKNVGSNTLISLMGSIL